MSWSTDFKADISLVHIVFRTKDELLDSIKEHEENINIIKQKLAMYAISSPKEIIEPLINEEDIFDKESRIDVIQGEVNDNLSYLEELIRELQALEMFLEVLENNPDKDIMEFYPYKDEKEE